MHEASKIIPRIFIDPNGLYLVHIPVDVVVSLYG